MSSIGVSDLSENAVADRVNLSEDAIAGPLVSVIIPAHNAEAFIATTLASAARQTYQHLEIIVVDDGSTDRTAEIVREFAAKDPRVTLLQQANAGVAAARNSAIRTARGSLIAPLDADDLWERTKIERQVACFRGADDRLALVYTWSHNIDDEGRIMWWKRNRPEGQGRVFDQLIEANLIGNGSTPLMRKDRVLEAGGYDPELRARDAEGCEDWKLYLTLAECYDFAVVRECLVGYRQTPGMMSRNLWAMKRSYDLLFDEVRRRHPDLPDELWRRNSTFFAIWLASIDVSAFPLMTAALRKDPLCFVRRTVRKQLFMLPLRYAYQHVRKRYPGLAGRLERLRKIGRKPFLDETHIGPAARAKGTSS
jgi:glycosyltransferase involved in cell wall biosynthesis